MKILTALIIITINPICSFAFQGPGVTAVFDSKKNNVSIKWQHSDKGIISYYLQRSHNNNTWTDIIKKPAAEFELHKIGKFTDEKPSPGKSYYRIKMLKSSGAVSYSSSLMVIVGKPGNNWLMYPVPVSKVLNLQYNGTEIIPGVITVYIRTMRGHILNRLRLASTTRFISMPVDNLGRGTYDVQIIIGNEVVWNQRFVK